MKIVGIHIKTTRKREFYLKRCIMHKLVDAQLVSDKHSEPTYVSQFVKEIAGDFLTDEGLSGGKKRTKRRRNT